MDLEAQVIAAIVNELERQAEASPGDLTVSALPQTFQVSGRVDLEELAMAVVGAVAGGPSPQPPWSEVPHTSSEMGRCGHAARRYRPCSSLHRRFRLLRRPFRDLRSQRARGARRLPSRMGPPCSASAVAFGSQAGRFRPRKRRWRVNLAGAAPPRLIPELW